MKDLIARIEALYAASTQGEWMAAPGNFIVAGAHHGDPESGFVVAEVPCQGANDSDVPYIIATHNAWPQLKAALEAQGRELEELKHDIDRYLTVIAKLTNELEGARSVVEAARDLIRERDRALPDRQQQIQRIREALAALDKVPHASK